MASTFTQNVSLEKPANGDDPNTWDVPVNADWDVLDLVLGGSVTINAVGASGTVVLTLAQYRPRIITVSGLLTANVNYQFPSGVGGQWSVFNNTTGAFTVTFSSGGAGSSVTLLQGFRTSLLCDGTNVSLVLPAGGSTGQLQYNAAGFFVGSANLTFDGTTLAAEAVKIGTLVVLDPNQALFSVENSSGFPSQMAYTGSAAAAANVLVLQSVNADFERFIYQGSRIGAIIPNGSGTGVSLISPSDERRKTKTGVYNPGDVFDRMNFYDYEWDNGARGFGPMAQELFGDAPWLVRPGDNDPDKRPGDNGFRQWMTTLSEPLTMAFAEIKALRARVKDLERKVAA